jgi:hypothetical protein
MLALRMTADQRDRLLRDYLRGQLDERCREALFTLLTAFRSWAQALLRVIQEGGSQRRN